MIRFDELLVALKSGDRANMAGGQKSLDRVVFAGGQHFHRRLNSHVTNYQREVRQAQLSGLMNGQGSRRGSRFEAHGEKDELSIGMPLGKSHGVERRIDDVDIATISPRLNKLSWLPGTRNMSPKLVTVTLGRRARSIACQSLPTE